MTRTKLGLVVGTALGTSLAFAPSGPARAENPDQRLQAIEAQIRALQVELKRVRQDVSARDQQVRAAKDDAAQARAEAHQAQEAARRIPATAPAVQAAAAPARDAPGFVSFPKGRPTISTDDGKYSIAIGLQLHYDIGGYSAQTHGRTDPRSVTRLDDFGQNVRRARLPVVFKAGDIAVYLTPDFGGSPDGSPTLYEANVRYTGIKNTTFLIGYYKPEITLGDSQSSNDFLFLERPSIVEIGRSVAAADSRATVGGSHYTPDYFAALYLTGGVYGQQATALSTGQSTGVVGRFAGRPFYTPDFDLLLGTSASDAFRFNRTPGAGETYQARDRPELRIDQNRLIDTGAIRASGAIEYGGEFAARYENLFLQGEYIEVRVTRDGSTNGLAAAPTPELRFTGGYAEASYTLTGEPRTYDPGSGSFVRPRPAEPASLSQGHYGAWEIAGRFSTVDLNSGVTPGVRASVTGGIYGGQQNVYGVALNWYPYNFMRFMLDLDRVEVDRLDPTGRTQIGQKFYEMALRTQVTF